MTALIRRAHLAILFQSLWLDFDNLTYPLALIGLRKLWEGDVEFGHGCCLSSRGCIPQLGQLGDGQLAELDVDKPPYKVGSSFLRYRAGYMPIVGSSPVTMSMMMYIRHYRLIAVTYEPHWSVLQVDEPILHQHYRYIRAASSSSTTIIQSPPISLSPSICPASPVRDALIARLSAV